MDLRDQDVRAITEAAARSRGAAVELLQKLISFDTTNIDQGARGREGEAQRWLAQYMAGLGMETTLFEPDPAAISRYRGYTPDHVYADRPNLVGKLAGSGGGRSLVLNSHIDTMPFGPRSLWSQDPLAGKIVNGRIYGRGSCDAKGCLATAVMAVSTLRSLGIRLLGNVLIHSVVDEEGGGNGTLASISRGLEAEAAIVLEPTRLSLFLGHVGWMFFRVVVHGRATHSSIKSKGVSAIDKSLLLIKAFSDLEARWSRERGNPMFPRPNINLGQMNAGVAGSVVPDTSEMKLCLHFPPNGDHQKQADAYEAQVREAVASVVHGDEWLREHPPEVEKYQQGDPFSINPDGEFALAMRKAVSAASRQNQPPAGAPYGCDARLISVNAGIPTVIFGPGSIEQAHAVDEFLDLDEYQRAITTVAAAILSWTGG